LNNKNKFSVTRLLVIPVVLVLGVSVFLLVKRMEGTPPTIELTLESPNLGLNQTIPLKVADAKSGLRDVQVVLIKDGQEIALFSKTYPSAGVFSGGVVREEDLRIEFDASAKGVIDGKAVLRLMVRDFSWRDWMGGNENRQELEVAIDTRPPGIDVLSRANYFAQGGAGLVAYKVSEECRTSGVTIGETFYPGFKSPFGSSDIYLAMIAVAYRQGPGTPVYATAVDLAGNQTRVSLPHLINARRFKQDKIPLSDSFLDWKMPEFANQVSAGAGASNVDIFLKVNSDLRKANYETIKQLTANPDGQIHWEGDFLRLPAAAPRAGFADHRSYIYKGKKIDEQTHMGIDLASLEQASVPAANAGKVVFSDTLGIYGGTILIDHGLGLFSMYSHLSQMIASPGQMVSKGETIGKTGVSGLAGGDHLHYSMLVHQTLINPVEWWDSTWIRNNISTKIEAVKR